MKKEVNKVDSDTAQEFLTESIKRFIDCEKQDMLKMINKMEDLEQQMINIKHKLKEQYILINDRYNSAFEQIHELERKVMQ